ncbi:DALR anticodon-binding domain-containing protein [Spiroplasma clarkii]|nr:DALR anticodon-binding domain-containing protein [Spiroplasma clarkii]
MEMVGKDSIRYMLVSKTPSSHMDFDLDVAVQKNSTNPVYYAQYATARCSKIINKAKADGLYDEKISFDLLTSVKERQLLILLDSFNKTVEYAASSRLPNIICDFIQNLAKRFHSYYADVKFFDIADEKLTKQRVQLVSAIYQVLANAFDLVGIEVINEM